MGVGYRDSFSQTIIIEWIGISIEGTYDMLKKQNGKYLIYKCRLHTYTAVYQHCIV